MPHHKRVCLLTGASGTLGTAFCERFSNYYDIAAIYNKHIPAVPSNLMQVVDPLEPRSLLEENAHPVFTIRADLSIPSEHARIIDLALARFSRIDLVVHAASYSVWADLLASNRVLDSFPAQLYMNAFVPLSISTQLLRRSWMHHGLQDEALNRNIINISSAAADKVYKGKGQSVYAASKAALNALTAHMADEFRPFGVRVNAVAPDSFPSRIAIDTVLDAILQLDEGTATEEIVRLQRPTLKPNGRPASSVYT